MSATTEQKGSMFATIRPEAERVHATLLETAEEVVRLLEERERFRQKEADYLSRRALSELEMEMVIAIPEADEAGKPLSEAKRNRLLAEAKAKSPLWKEAQARMEVARSRLSSLDAQLEAAQIRFRALEAALGWYSAILRFRAQG